MTTASELLEEWGEEVPATSRDHGAEHSSDGDVPELDGMPTGDDLQKLSKLDGQEFVDRYVALLTTALEATAAFAEDHEGREQAADELARAAVASTGSALDGTLRPVGVRGRGVASGHRLRRLRSEARRSVERRNPISASNDPLPSARTALRLRLTATPEAGSRMHGGWWPQSDDLAMELADLADHFPAELGTISRAWVSPPDWASPPQRVSGVRGVVKVRSLPREDSHVIELQVSGRRILRLLVVPPDMSVGQGEEAMLAAATPRHSYSAASILDVAGEFEDVDSFDHWEDSGGSWWDPHPTAPSFRPEA